VQSRFVRVEPGEILLMPDVPAQANPWNNEYTVSISARCSGHGALRASTYARRLRTPLLVSGFTGETGILTGRANNPHVSITGGVASADAALRIQAVLDMRTDALLFSLLDMQEGGKSGAAAQVDGNGEITLYGFAGSAVSSLTVRVNNYAALKEMVKDDYGGWLADVLEVKTA
jgi:hypothetical protein